MFYKLAYENPKNNTSLVEELNCKKDEAQDRAEEILEENEKKGEVVITRRYSEWYGDFEHYLTISYLDNTQA
jgi:hypothetical protein